MLNATALDRRGWQRCLWLAMAATAIVSLSALGLPAVSADAHPQQSATVTSNATGGDERDDSAGNGHYTKLTVIKKVKAVDGNDAVVAQGWGFVTTSSKVMPKKLITNQTGTGTFKIDMGLAKSRDITVAETARDGFKLMQQNGLNAACIMPSLGVTADVTNVADTGFVVNVPAGINVTCVVVNEEIDSDAAPLPRSWQAKADLVAPAGVTSMPPRHSETEQPTSQDPRTWHPDPTAVDRARLAETGSNMSVLAWASALLAVFAGALLLKRNPN